MRWIEIAATKGAETSIILHGEIVNMPSGRVLNFADNEENYFAVMEKK